MESPTLTPITQALFRQRRRRLVHRIRNVDVPGALRLALLVGIGAFILIDGLGRLWIDRPLALADASLRRADLLASSLRLSVLMGAVISFDSFGDLWRSREQEILGNLPLPATSIYLYRLSSVALRGLPFLAIVVVLWIRVLLSGESDVFLDGCVLIGLGYGAAVVWGLYWHLVAGAGVANPDSGPIKEMAAGAVTSSERALLLYSPMFALATSFGISFIGLLALDAYRDGTSAGLLVTALCLGGVALGVLKGWQRFDADYYVAMAALADGDALEGAFTEAEPGPDYFGGWFAERLPSTLRPLVVKDLRQAWRRNRMAPWALVGLSVALVLLGGRLGVWLPAACGALVLAASAEIFRFARGGSDAPWFWLTLPQRLRTLYLSRLVGGLFYVLIVTPGVATALWRGGQGAWALGLPMVLGVGLALLAMNLSTLGLGGGRFGLWVHWMIGGAAVALGAPGLLGEGGAILPMVLGGGALGMLSLGILPGLGRRLAQLEMAR